MGELVEIKKCKVSLIGLTFDENLNYTDWKQIGLQLQMMHKSCGFWIGDWWNFGVRKYGEAKATAASLDMDYGTFRNYIWVSDAFDLSCRHDNLSFSVHFEAAQAGEKRFEILEEASKNNLSSRETRELVKEIKKLPTPPLPKGKYQVIYADPPWEYDVDLSTGATRSPENNYPVMNLEELKEFSKKVKEISVDDCVLFMWITAPKLNWLNEVLEAWGFEYKTNFIWDKIKPNLGHYSSVRHEILIIAVKGNYAPLCDGKTIQSIDSVQQVEKSLRHSEKPEKFRKIIETLYPDTKKIELFARKKVDGWDTWGLEA